MEHFIFKLNLFLCMCYALTALDCLGCSLKTCRKPVGCRGGVVKDACNCCDICAKTFGEVCGGPFEIFGKCGAQLQCFKNITNEASAFNAQGTCQPICGPVCKIFCPYGNVLDGKGCPTCSCNTIPKCTTPAKVNSLVEFPLKPPVCPHLICSTFIKCAHGQVINGNGCPTCSCRSLPVSCDKQGCCNQLTRFCTKNNSCCIHDSTCFNRLGWYQV